LKLPAPIRSNIKEFQKFHDEEATALEKMSIEEKPMDEESLKKSADEYKEKGNAFVKAKDYESGLKMYTMAIETYSNDAVYYSNRSQCFLELEKYEECIEDTKKSLAVNDCFAKSYFRQMKAYEKMGQNMRALSTCQRWMEKIPNDQTSQTNYDRIHNKIIEENNQRKRSQIKWSKYPKEVNFVEKKPHMQSKKPLKSIPVHLKKSQSPIPEHVLDKIFNNNTGEHVPEPKTDSKLFKTNFFDKTPIVKPTPIKPEPEEKSVVNEKNEILKASERIPSLDELQGLKNNLISLPQSGPQFYTSWKELNEELKFLYLKNLADNSIDIGKLLGATLNSDMLSEIIQIIHKYFMHHNLPYIQLLHNLSKNIEIPILSMFFTPDTVDAKKLTELLDNTNNGGDNNVNNMIQQIKKNFGI
jgi:tetratricopeptide (TPR) repeat protein